MAIAYVSSSSEGHETAQASAGMPTAYPITIAIRFRKEDLANAGHLMCLVEKGTGEGRRIDMAVNASNQLVGFVKASNSQQFATTLTSPTVSANTWYTAVWCLISNTERRLYLDSSSQTAGGTGLSSAPLNEVKDYAAVGFLNFFGTPGVEFFDGQLAEAAIWDVQLSDDEIDALGAGASPLRIRRPVRYWPLLGDDVDNVPELIEGVGLSAKHGTPVSADHPRVLQPAKRTVFQVPAAAQSVVPGLAQEADSGLGVSPGRSHELGSATEIDDTPNLAPVRRVAIGEADAVATALALDHCKSLSLGQAPEADAALPLEGGTPSLGFSRHFGLLRDVGRLTN